MRSLGIDILIIRLLQLIVADRD